MVFSRTEVLNCLVLPTDQFLCICFTVSSSLQNIRVMAKYYTRVRIARMAELLDLTGDVSTVLFLFLNEAINKS